MILKNNNGRFEDNGKCYVINKPDTPRRWQNYIYDRSGNFQLVVTQRGRGESFYYSTAANTFSLGRNYCILNKDSGKCWSVNGGDAPTEPESYRCEHYPGRTVFKVSNQAIESELLITAATDEPIELNRLTLKNNSDKDVELSVIGFQEAALNGIGNDQQTEKTNYDGDSGAVLAQKSHFATPTYKYAAYYISDTKPDSYTGSLESIFDSDAPRSCASVWRTGRLPKINAHSTKIALALQHNLTVKAGDSVIINYGLGLADDITDAATLAKEFVSKNKAADIPAANERYFDEILNKGNIDTEDNIINYMSNVWSRLQLHRQVLIARGSATHNWRNNLQDAWGWMVFEPQWARKRLYEMCSLANDDGFLRRTSLRVPEIGNLNHYLVQRHGDIATWAGLLAARYAAETGDFGFFGEEVVYASGKKKATVGQCLINAIQWLLDHKGTNGMILMLDGDWSDPLEEAGREGIGESPWTSVALVNTIKSINPLLERLGYKQKATEFEAEAKALTEAVNKNAWDGEWYIRGITDKGIRFGKSDDPDANVSLMMQAWALISGVVPQHRKASVLKAIDEFVKTEIGPILYGPPFLKWRPEIGRETVKQPGTGENGSVYVHAGMMLASAEIAAGRADEALDIIKKILPAREPDCCDITRDIPLWMPNFYHSTHSPTPGLSSGIIGTGALAWFFLDLCEGLLGIKPQFDGILVEPLFPSMWNKASFERQWRGSVFNFDYKRDDDATGVILYLNGSRLETNFIPEPVEKSEYSVEVIIGK